MSFTRFFFISAIFALGSATAAAENTYLVQLRSEPAATALRQLRRSERQHAAPRLRQQVQAAQAIALKRLAIRGELLAATDTLANVLIVRVSPQEAERLARQPEVSRVEKAGVLYPAMDRAVDVQQVRPVWELVGGIDKAGAGMKIGIIDSGVDFRHPAFQDPDLTPPEGYPKSDSDGGLQFTNSKVIVQRNYEKILNPQATPSYVDDRGHGTSVASVAAGARHDTGAGIFAGVAPKAWLGSYKVFTPSRDTTSNAAYLKAIDDAASDGMDVVNLSIGGGDWDSGGGIVSAAERRAMELGMHIVYSAGNNGPARGSVTVRPEDPVILVGAAANSRFFGGRVRLDEETSYPAIPVEPPDTPSEPVVAPLRAVSELDGSGLACDPLPTASLQGMIAVVIRGQKPGFCNQTVKQRILKDAGAVGFLMLSDPTSPQARGVVLGVLPGMRVSYEHGAEILAKLKQAPRQEAKLDFAWQEQAAALEIANFSSRGPGWELSIKPDVTAVGLYVWLAAPNGRYQVGDGTSYSAPMVAGALAVLKQARPGLEFWHYRSLIINTARELWQPVMEAGSGLLDLERAVQGTVVANPVSISFGAGASFDLTRKIKISNLGENDSFALHIEPLGDGPAPTVDPLQLTLAKGGEATVSLRLDVKDIPIGEYQGFLVIEGSQPAARARIPYWFARSSGRTEAIALSSSITAGKPGDLIEDALLFRTTDRFGIPMARGISWRRTAGDALGFGPYRLGDTARGMWQFDMRMGPKAGRSVFRFTSDDAVEEAWYTATGDDAERFLVPNTLYPAMGDVVAGQVRDLTLRFFNLGRTSVTIREIRFPNAAFTLRSPALPLTIAAGGFADVVLRFAPTTRGPVEGWMIVISNDAQLPNLYMWLSGRGA